MKGPSGGTAVPLRRVRSVTRKRPPGARTRKISRRAFPRSAVSESTHSARQASKAPSQNGRDRMSPHTSVASAFSSPVPAAPPRAKGPGCQSTPQARSPCSATQAAVAPGPQPQSRTLAPSGSPALRMRSSPYAVSFRPPGRSVSPEASRKAFEPYRGRLIYPPEGPQPRPSCRLPVPQAPESCHILDSGEA